MFRRRRPILGAAMLGGAAYAGRKSQQRAYEKQDQEARIEDLEAQQQQQAYAAPPPPQAPPPPAPPAPAPAAPAAGPALVDQLKQLSDLKTAGALSDEEFEAAKQKLLAG
jgi:hypothetical protein